MKAFLNIIHRTIPTFNYLDEQFEDDLDVNVTILFILSGLIIATESFFKDRLNGLSIGFIILIFIFGAAVGLIFGKFIISYLIFCISMLLKGKAKLIDIKVVVAYSLIPRILELPIILYLGLTGKYGQLVGVEYHLITGLFIILSIMTFKILIQGLMIFNGFGFWKSFLNVIPFVLIGIFLYFFILSK